MVGDRDEASRLDRGVDRAAGIRQRRGFAPRAARGRGRRRRRWRAEAPRTGARGPSSRRPCTSPKRPRTSVPAWPTAVEAGQPGISPYGISTGVGDRVGEPAEPAAEHDADRGPKPGAGRDRVDRGVERLAQADPSAARASIISTTRCTASSGSSVRCSSSRSDGDTSPSASISPRTQSSISPQ